MASPNNPAKKLSKVREAIERGIADGVFAAALECEAIAKVNVTNAPSVDRGQMRNSIRTQFARGVAVPSATVYVGAAYGRWVEFGRRGTRSSPTRSPNAAQAAFPPLAVIRAWVSRKFRTFAPSGRTKSGRARRPSASDVDSVAFLVGRKIYLDGIRPRPFLGPAYTVVSARLPLIIDQWVRRAIARAGL